MGSASQGVPTWTDKIGSCLCTDVMYLKQSGIKRDPCRSDGAGKEGSKASPG